MPTSTIEESPDPTTCIKPHGNISPNQELETGPILALASFEYSDPISFAGHGSNDPLTSWRRGKK